MGLDHLAEGCPLAEILIVLRSNFIKVSVLLSTEKNAQPKY